jgi:plasmid maintenance system antidote protein VapI
MTPKQLQRFLGDAGLTQSGAARLIGITPRHMRRFIAGDAPVPLAIEYALRWVVSQQGSKGAAARAADKHK